VGLQGWATGIQLNGILKYSIFSLSLFSRFIYVIVHIKNFFFILWNNNFIIGFPLYYRWHCVIYKQRSFNLLCSKLEAFYFVFLHNWCG
jgi:hypothetical protein